MGHLRGCFRKELLPDARPCEVDLFVRSSFRGSPHASTRRLPSSPAILRNLRQSTARSTCEPACTLPASRTGVESKRPLASPASDHHAEKTKELAASVLAQSNKEG